MKLIAPLFLTFTFLLAGCSAVLEDPYRIVLEVDYDGEWSGVIAYDNFYTPEDNVPNQPVDGAESVSINGVGMQEYTYIPDYNWYYISATKEDIDSTNELFVRIYKYKPNEDEKWILTFNSTTNITGAVSTNIYTPDYDL